MMGIRPSDWLRRHIFLTTALHRANLGSDPNSELRPVYLTIVIKFENYAIVFEKQFAEIVTRKV
jgi:hypothetical protein